MALSNRINMRISGGGTLGKYLYKNGVDNTALTGGLSTTGYTFMSNYNISGSVTFEDSDILLNPTNGSAYCVVVGSTRKIDFTEINSVIVKYHHGDNVIKSATIDTTSITGEYYISFSDYQSTGSLYRLGIGITSAKTYVWSSTGYRGTSDNQSRLCYITEIEYT